jgi:hypothetical protein
MVRFYDRQLLASFVPIVLACGALFAATCLVARALERARARLRAIIGFMSAASTVAEAFVAAGHTGLLVELLVAGAGP